MITGALPVAGVPAFWISSLHCIGWYNGIPVYLYKWIDYITGTTAEMA